MSIAPPEGAQDRRLARFTTALRKLADIGAVIEAVDDDLLHVVLPDHIRAVEHIKPGMPGAFRLVTGVAA